MASRYMRYSLVNKYYLAKELYDSGHSEAPTMSKLDELQALADVVNGKLLEAYGRRPKSGGYAWSGLAARLRITWRVLDTG